MRNQRDSFAYEQAETGCGRKSSAVNAVTYEEVCSEKNTINFRSPESDSGAVTKGLTNCAPQVKEEPGTGCCLVLQLVLIGVALDAVCFVSHLFLCWD